MNKSKDDTGALKTENALLKFDRECAERLAKHDKLVREVEFYGKLLKWTGLGSLVGLTGLVALLLSAGPWVRNYTLNHIDQQVTSRMRAWNTLEQGIAAAHEARWTEALEKLWDVYSRHQTERQGHADEEDKFFSQYQSLLFTELLLALASDADQSGSHWFGEDKWEILSKDPSFIGEFMNAGDEAYYTRMFLCNLKFNKGSDSLNQIISYLQQACSHAPSEQGHAPHYFKLAIADLLKGNDACKQLDKAASFDHDYGRDKLADKLKRYQDEPEFQMWHTYAQQMNIEFDSKFAGLIGVYEVHRTAPSLSETSPQSN